MASCRECEPRFPDDVMKRVMDGFPSNKYGMGSFRTESEIIIAHGGDYLSAEVHANRDLTVKGTVVASPSQCLWKKIIFVINGMQQLNLD
ncbi:hypothetical protein CDAR_121531 [Caerostris darwini]|uniref:Uncharacterized protein n=1 Tax=Caerostris darwini TaxID=1538125 RepID=A0AAV4V9Z6_9ARAC|nr:hypothetical protein CDAR_121531 [Caerostris darwini]